MGQTTSFLDFSQRVSELHYLHYDLSFSGKEKEDFWKAVFLTTLTDDEICSFFSFDDVRRLRRFHPDRLAIVLLKCLSQIQQFVDNHNSISDYCAVLNALRMIGNALPYVFEDFGVEGTKVASTSVVTARTRALVAEDKKTTSVFAEDFATHFFLHNRTCRGTEAGASAEVFTRDMFEVDPHVPLDVPFGQTLTQLLTALCFVPRFSVGPYQVLPSGNQLEEPMTPPTSNAVKIHDPLLWYGSKTSSGGVAFRQIDPRRLQVLRVLSQCLSWNVFRGSKDLTANPFLQFFLDESKVPLGPTLAASFLYRISTHESRGTVPYSSYMNADHPEKILAFSLTLLALSYEMPPLRDVVQADGSHVQRVNSFHAAIEKLLANKTDSNTVENVVIGLIRIIDNPLYASRTYLKDSQKTVECSTEAILLLFHLLELRSVRDALLKPAMIARLIPALCFVIDKCSADDARFVEMQLVLFVLLRLSTSTAFLEFLATPLSSQPPLAVIPDLMKRGEQGTYADLLILMMCFIVSPGSPRWFLPAFKSAATVFCNIMTLSPVLLEVTCFEIHHTLEFLTLRNVLRRGIATQSACQLWVEGIATVLMRNMAGVLPLAASLAVGVAVSQLKKVIEGDVDAAAAENAPAEGSSKSTTKPLVLMDRFADDMPFEALIRHAEDAKRKLEKSTFSGRTDLNSNRQDMYAVVADTSGDGGSVMMPATLLPSVRAMDVSNELRYWLSTVLWRLLHKRNLRPPLFDFRTAKVFA